MLVLGLVLGGSSWVWAEPGQVPWVEYARGRRGIPVTELARRLHSGQAQQLTRSLLRRSRADTNHSPWLRNLLVEHKKIKKQPVTDWRLWNKKRPVNGVPAAVLNSLAEAMVVERRAVPAKTSSGKRNPLYKKKINGQRPTAWIDQAKLERLLSRSGDESGEAQAFLHRPHGGGDLREPLQGPRQAARVRPADGLLVVRSRAACLTDPILE